LFDEQQSIEPQAPAKPAPSLGQRSGKQQAIVIQPEAAAPAAPAPAPAAPAPSVAHVDDLSVAPAAAPSPDATPNASWATGSRTNYLGGGLALVVIVGGLLAWKPWKGGAPEAGPSPIAAQTVAPATPDPDPSSLVTPVSATTPPVGTLTGAGAAIPVA